MRNVRQFQASIATLAVVAFLMTPANQSRATPANGNGHGATLTQFVVSSGGGTSYRSDGQTLKAVIGYVASPGPASQNSTAVLVLGLRPSVAAEPEAATAASRAWQLYDTADRSVPPRH